VYINRHRSIASVSIKCVLLCFIDPRVRKIRNEASSCLGIFSRPLRFYYIVSSLGSPLPHLLDGHRKRVGSSVLPARSCPGPVKKEERKQKCGYKYRTEHKTHRALKTGRQTGREESMHTRHRLIDTGKRTRNVHEGDRGYYW